jgi:hypothetical protein
MTEPLIPGQDVLISAKALDPWGVAVEIRTPDGPKAIYVNVKDVSAPPPPARERREAIAQEVYAAMTWAVDHKRELVGFPVPKWIPGGNSHAQDEARRATDTILALALPPTPGDEAVERVALAILRVTHPEYDDLADAHPATRTRVLAESRAAIAALSQPQSAGRDQHPVPNKDQSLSVEGKPKTMCSRCGLSDVSGTDDPWCGRCRRSYDERL